MMNRTNTLTYQGSMVRCVEHEGDIWFIARDVCNVLGLVNVPRSLDRLAGFMKGVHTVNTLGGPQDMAIISEAGLYKLTFTSRKEEAESFTNWVATEVLPIIRKRGAYVLPERVTDYLSNPELLGSLAKAVTAERAKREALEHKLLLAKPMVEFAHAVMDSKTDIPIGDTAKLITQAGYPIGRNELFAWLREHGWLIRKRCQSYNMPTQKAVNAGVLSIRETVWNRNSDPIIFRTPMITGKGQVFFIDLFIAAAREVDDVCPA